jgi:hypothetical protein
MERHIHEQNLAQYRRLLAESDRNPERNEVQHNWLLKLLTDEEAEDAKPRYMLIGVGSQRRSAR